MIFTELTLADAEGAILAHSVRVAGRLWKKGRTLTAPDIAALRTAGIANITAARLEPGDVAEDDAARRMARALGGDGVRIGAAFTGRANLYAEAEGLVVFEPGTIDTANRTHEALTIATLLPYARVAKGDMLATVKVIPYAAPESAVAMVESLATPISVAAFRPLNIGLVSTVVSGMKPQLVQKNVAALNARIAPLGGTLSLTLAVPHSSETVGEALRSLQRDAQPPVDAFFVFGASAISDRRDVVPAGIEAAGGNVEHFGMPVDPGNLLLLGALGGKPVIGLPGCARSPKLNGFDFVLWRLFAGLPVTSADISGMGVGGLLSDIPSRPQPRETAPVARASRIAGIVLAAGMSSRMGANKLTAKWQGKPIIRRTVEALLASHTSGVYAVLGHDADAVLRDLDGLPVQIVNNPNYSGGLSTSLRAGIKALPECDGAIVLLGDMPEIRSSLINRMIAAFSPDDGRAIVVATHNGKRGNPVLWARSFFGEIENIAGDTGAKHLIGENEDVVCEIEADSDEVLTDVDTPEELAALRKRTPASI